MTDLISTGIDQKSSHVLTMKLNSVKELVFPILEAEMSYDIPLLNLVFCFRTKLEL